jgi:hypothetical protein
MENCRFCYVKIKLIEPIFFIFFGVFHIHRVWGLFDRKGYANFWLSAMNNRDWFYFLLMGVLSLLCIMGIMVFITNKSRNYWWRWVYILGGGYLIFDLFAIFIRMEIWNSLLYWLFNIENSFWNIIWGFFIGLGFSSLILGIVLSRKLIKQKQIQSLIGYNDKLS